MRRPLALVTSLALALAGALALPDPAAAAPRSTLPEQVTTLAVAAPGQTLNDPAVLSVGNAVIAAWTVQSTVGGQVVRTLEVRRRTGAWVAVPLTAGGLDQVGAPSLTEDPATGRVLLTASASSAADLAGTLGTYLWWSADQGATFTGPVRVYDSFGVGDAAPDGAGGFWSVVGQAGASVVHVPASYAMQHEGTAEVIPLTDRIGSRGAIALATGGAAYTPVLGFQAGTTGLWSHTGTVGGQAADVQLYPSGGGLTMGVAGNPTGVVTAAVHQDAGRGYQVLATRTVDPVTGAAGPERRLSLADAVFFDLSSRPGGRTEFDAAWTARGDELYSSSLAPTAAGAWQPVRHIMSGERSGLGYLAEPAISSSYVVGLANRASDSTQVIWAATTDPLLDAPDITTKRSSYSVRKHAIVLRLRTATTGRVKATVVVTGIARRPVKDTTRFTVTRIGTVRQQLKVPKATARRLAAHPRARITVRLTMTNAAGRDRATVKVVR